MTEITSRLSTALADRYKIERRLREGGGRLLHRTLTTVVLLSVSTGCTHGENSSDCQNGVLGDAVVGREGPVSATGRSVIHYRVPRSDLTIHDLAVAPDGAVWYTDQLNSCIGRLDPRTGLFTEYSAATPGTSLHGIAVDSTGAVWYAASQRGRLGRLDPATGRSLEYDLPTGVRDVHTVLAHAGRVWFTAPGSDLFGYFEVRTSTARTFPGSSPYGMAVAPDGAIWFALSGTDSLARFSPDQTLSHWHLATADSRPLLIASDGDGRIWYTDRDRSKIGVVDPASGQVHEFPTVSEQAFPRSIAVGPDGLVWFAEQRTGFLVGFDPAAGTYESGQVDEPDESVRHMVTDHARGRLWLAVWSAGALARLETAR